MDTPASAAIAAQILGIPDAIPHTADWKQAPYFEEKYEHRREQAMQRAEHLFEVLAASMTMGNEIPING